MGKHPNPRWLGVFLDQVIERWIIAGNGLKIGCELLPELLGVGE